jgi:hypothetical protein
MGEGVSRITSPFQKTCCSHSYITTLPPFKFMLPDSAGLYCSPCCHLPVSLFTTAPTIILSNFIVYVNGFSNNVVSKFVYLLCTSSATPGEPPIVFTNTEEAGHQ